MHDLMHDLAISVAGKFFFMLDDKVDTNRRNQDFEKFRHFSFISERDLEDRMLKELHRARCMRTFLPVPAGGWERYNKLDDVLIKLATRLQFLRVLSLPYNSITKVPKSIGNLKHLRYLNFSGTGIKHLPKQVGKLYNLQSLLVRDCYKLRSLPKSFAKLKNLRHLDMAGTPLLKNTPVGIGGSTSLRTLSKVIIEGRNGFKISELKGLSDLQGALYIQGLDKVKHPNEAKDANLQEKKGLDNLELVWDKYGSRDPVIEYDVLEMLRPPCKLKTLSISYYGGMKFPSWLGDPSFDHLTQLTLADCKNCTELATLEHLTSLEKLEVAHCRKLVSIKGVGSSIMPSLRRVNILKCDSLESYCCPNSVEHLYIDKCSSMRIFQLRGLQNLKSLSLGEIKKPMSEWGLQNYPSSLVELHLNGKNSGVVSFGVMEQEEDHTMNNTTTSTCFFLPASLTLFSIIDFEEVESVSEVLQHLPHLRILSIEHCLKLRDVPESTSSLFVQVLNE